MHNHVYGFDNKVISEVICKFVVLNDVMEIARISWNDFHSDYIFSPKDII